MLALFIKTLKKIIDLTMHKQKYPKKLNVLCTVLFSFCRKIHWKNIRVIYFFAYLHIWKHKKIGLYFLFQCFYCACSLVITTSYQTVTNWIYTGCTNPISRCLEGARGSWQASVTVSYLFCLLKFDTCCLNPMISHYIEIYLLNRYTHFFYVTHAPLYLHSPIHKYNILCVTAL
jgi:hypothetical protein